MNSQLRYFEQSETIPRNIHQTFFDKLCLPVEIEKNIEKLRGDNPGWNYVIYDDEDIEKKITHHFGSEILTLYKRINPEYGAARADFFRYLIMYAEGGVYLDIKSTLSRPLDDMLARNEKFVLSKWQNHSGQKHAGWGLHPELESFVGGEYQQWFIVSPKGHPYLRSVIECVIKNIQNYNINIHGVGKKAVLRVTGPIAYTLAIESVKDDALGREVGNIEKIGIHHSLYAEKRKHEEIFKNHYSRLKTPLIIPGDFTSVMNLFIYTNKKRIKKLKKKIKRRLKKIFF